MTKILKATSGRLFGRVTSGTGRAEELTPGDVRTLLEVETAAAAAAAYQPIGDYATGSQGDLADSALQPTDIASGTITPYVGNLDFSGGLGGITGTGSVDNAALRADGTGGATLQSSSWILNDNLTASPNNTVNHACLEATGSTTNVSVSIKPKGTGAFCLAAPDGASTGGNARGANAVDLQTSRSAASQVASGQSSFVVGGSCTGSGIASIAMGLSCTVSGETAVALGQLCSSSANYASAMGYDCTASQQFALAVGRSSLADRVTMFAQAGGQFAARGDAQRVGFVVRAKTTNATPGTLLLNGATRLTIPSGKVASLICTICGIKSDGSAVANYVRRVVIKNVGGTTSVVGSVETVGTDIEDNASTDVTVTADNTNDALDISVTGIAGETWRWVAVVDGLEIAYGV